MTAAAGAGLAPILEWTRCNLDRRLSVAELARKAGMSPRTFARQFRHQTGTTPHQWIMHQRLLAAQLLEQGASSVDRIAESVGLQTAVTLRQHFARFLGVTPTAYRRRFALSVQPERCVVD